MTRVLVRAFAALLALALLGVVAVWGVVTFLRAQDGEPRAAERCTAVNEGVRHPLSHEQAENAALLAAASVRRGMPARAATIAIATAMQESSLRNLDHGDRDSLGLFQQRPSQGWGEPEEILDPVYSTHTFYDALDEVAGYEQMEVTVAAQSVQRSAFPEAYAQHEPMSRAWASALTGHSPGAVTCVVHSPAEGSTEALLERLKRDLGELPVELEDPQDGPARLEIDARPLAGAGGEGVERLAWAVGQWAVALSAPLGVEEVTVGERRWDVKDARWSALAEDAEPVGPGRVRLRLNG